MKRLTFSKFLTCLLFLLPCLYASSEENFFLVNGVTKEIVLKQGPNIEERISPCSTFKIFLSLVGYDAEILKDQETPIWDFQEGYVDHLKIWKASQNPKSWMKNSCVWYSQLLTPQLGLEKIKDYLTLLKYGNQDISGGLTKFWLSSSLKISPKEQVEFIQKMLERDFAISEHAIDMTKSILFVDEFLGWKLFGKTGMGSTTEANGKILESGWFVGWIEKNEESFSFAYNIREEKITPSQRVPRVKQLLIKSKIINEPKKDK